MKILIACEFSGIVREAFTKLGYDATSCDMLPSDKPDGKHYQGDVREILDQGWDLMIAHPPCTYLTNSGVSWLVRKKDMGNGWVPVKETNIIPDAEVSELFLNIKRYRNMVAGAYFFKDLLHVNIPYIAIENPIMHKYAIDIIERRQDQCVQPYQFGEPYQKATCFWLKNLPKLQATKIVAEREQYSHNLPLSKDRWKLRSKTYQGIADAMAQQWGSYVDMQLRGEK